MAAKQSPRVRSPFSHMSLPRSASVTPKIGPITLLTISGGATLPAAALSPSVPGGGSMFHSGTTRVPPNLEISRIVPPRILGDSIASSMAAATSLLVREISSVIPYRAPEPGAPSVQMGVFTILPGGQPQMKFHPD